MSSNVWSLRLPKLINSSQQQQVKLHVRLVANSRQILAGGAAVGLQEQQRNLTLKAQQPGEVFNLSVGPGSVIGSGAEVMRIVPDGGGLKGQSISSQQRAGFY